MKLYITEQEVLATLPMAKAIELVDGAFRQLADGTAVNHPRRRLILPTGSILHYMAGGGPDYFGIKVYSSNPKTGAHFEVLLYRSADGMPLATIEANHLGQIRTGRGERRGHEYLAREDAGIAGSHRQRLSGGDADRRDLQCRNAERSEGLEPQSPERRTEFARALREKIRPERACDRDRAGGRGRRGIVVTATSSREPVLETEWISPGTHINAMGSNWATRRELPTDS